MAKTRVLFVIGRLSGGGTGLQLLRLARGLNRERFEPLVVCLSEASTHLFSKFYECNIPTVVLAREKQGRWRTLWNLARLVGDFNPAVVHAFGYASRSAIAVSKLFSRSRTIVSIRTHPGREVNRLDQFIHSFADRMLTNSGTSARAIDFGPWRDVPIKVIYKGIDLQKFDADMCSNVAPTLPRGATVICAVARLHPGKDLDVLLRAFAILSRSRDDIRLWLVGDGPEKKNLEEQSVRLGIKAKVVFWGQRENIPAILKHVKIGVLSSQYEGLPHSVIEYMAAGLPVVATDVGGVGEVVLDGETGFLIPPGIPRALADKILVLLNDPEIACQFGKAGRRRVESCFTLKRTVMETEAVYQSVIQHG